MNRGNLNFLDGVRCDRLAARRLGTDKRVAKHQKLWYEARLDGVDLHIARCWTRYLGHRGAKRCCYPPNI
jgi:hypothetical protein